MARTVVTTPLTGADLFAYVEAESDFQFEMQVFQVCSQRFSRAEHGGYYLEANTGKRRQFDIRAHQFGGGATLGLAVECKNLHASHPLLISRVPRTVEESFHDLIILQPPPAILPYTSRLSDFGSVFRSGIMVGKAMAHVSKTVITETGKPPRDEYSGKDADVYERWAQAVFSAHDLIQRTVTTVGEAAPCAYAVLPVLVVPNGTLWKVDYLPTGERESSPVSVDRCDYYLGAEIPSPYGVYTLSHLVIFTFDGFVTFTNELFRSSPLDTTLWHGLFPMHRLKPLLPGR